MTTFFDASAQNELLQRLEKLTADTRPIWGKMTASQMLAHCSAAYQTATGELTLTPPPFFIRLLGRLIKKSMLGTKPYSKNSPTAPELKMRAGKAFEEEKRKFLENFRNLAVGPQAVKVSDHPFFGPMTPAEWGRHMYKHTDYHFGQFGI